MPSTRPAVTHTPSGKPITHGAAAYTNYGCGCSVCRIAASAQRADLRARRAAGDVIPRRGRPGPVVSSTQASDTASDEAVK